MVDTFAKMIGSDSITTPYHVQRPIPIRKITSMAYERSCAERDRHVFITCGRNDIVVRNPAIRPIAIIWSISAFTCWVPDRIKGWRIQAGGENFAAMADRAMPVRTWETNFGPVLGYTRGNGSVDWGGRRQSGVASAHPIEECGRVFDNLALPSDIGTKRDRMRYENSLVMSRVSVGAGR